MGIKLNQDIQFLYFSDCQPNYEMNSLGIHKIDITQWIYGATSSKLIFLDMRVIDCWESVRDKGIFYTYREHQLIFTGFDLTNCPNISLYFGEYDYKSRKPLA